MNPVASSHSTPACTAEALISVVIPTLNEASNIATTLKNVAQRCSEPQRCEIILADGYSTDKTLNVAHKCKPELEERGLDICLVQSERGRARQMNLGAERAHGEILLFLHADTHLPPNFDTNIRTALAEYPKSLGGFSLTTERQNLPLRCICKGANLRARLLHLPYGDQALFIRRDYFMHMQMFPSLEIMEDFAMARQVKRSGGSIQILPDTVSTSARRWRKRGYLFTTLCNQIIILGYYLRIPTRILSRWYRR